MRVNMKKQGYDKWRTTEGEAEGCKMAMYAVSKELRERLQVQMHWYYSRTGCVGMGMCCEKKMMSG